MDYPEMKQYMVACQTTDCENYGVDIEVPALAENPTIVCGPCMTLIAKVTPL